MFDLDLRSGVFKGWFINKTFENYDSILEVAIDLIKDLLSILIHSSSGS